ncbi:MAG: hypothetical protein N0C81_14850 [Candidatus Thiodiazotropha lotti]|nr:hypothetical protein [Candidatus Thiodiazotropha lotti]MCG8004537.1 hypothetical protein [Candidatus Thiodiazotropha lotti]MCG8008907.1 hypothetical protein [Candidatus Thiodiazotropha lotti]MCW4188162.1 hypothetical protein [Candidatus Thiodiazotropha lotti]MCW4196496.1 hypothetical protein [Candidatus Thiodiazotropha lotti]
MADTIDWPGLSGKNYTYFIYQLPHNSFKKSPGNYIFCKVVNNEWVPVYFGETEDLSERFDTHHASACIKRNGASHIHVHITRGDKRVRLAEETDLRQHYETACNKQ